MWTVVFSSISSSLVSAKPSRSAPSNLITCRLSCLGDCVLSSRRIRRVKFIDRPFREEPPPGTFHEVLLEAVCDLPSAYRFHDDHRRLDTSAVRSSSLTLASMSSISLALAACPSTQSAALTRVEAGGVSGIFRSLVDEYRPDLDASWVKSKGPDLTCSDVPDCVAALLLTLHDGDDPNSFARKLLQNVAVSESLAGFLRTFDFLEDLVSRQRNVRVRTTACIELAKWYSLELPPPCLTLLRGTEEETAYPARLAKIREELNQGGPKWLRARVRPKNDAEMRRYLVHMLANSADHGTREDAQRLIAALPQN
jgi:hypothetical protein